ncbi:hypothetical protein [Moraxella lacunata]|uniref:hypothetical protein n=1 Tax=Moraxella lacunata TaxID=477 RepID=UPI003EE14546
MIVKRQPPCLATWASMSTTAILLVWSSPLVGSSAMTIYAPLTVADAKDARCAMPPDSSCG